VHGLNSNIQLPLAGSGLAWPTMAPKPAISWLAGCSGSVRPAGAPGRCRWHDATGQPC